MTAAATDADDAWPRRRGAAIGRVATALLLGGGLALLVWLVVAHDLDRVLALLETLGGHVATVSLAYSLAIVAGAAAWYVVIRRALPGVGFGRLVVYRWIGDAVNQLLPVAQIGGEMVRTRLLVLAARPALGAATASAATVVDLTAGFVALMLYILFGLVALAVGVPGADGLPAALWIGFGLFALVLAVMIWAQRSGVLAALAGRLRLGSVAAAAERFRTAIDELYRVRWDFVWCVVWRLVAWMLGGGAIWLTLALLGTPVTLVEALVIDSLAQGIRNAAFAVPGGYGAQEGGYVMTGALVGVSPEAALAVALTKRARDILVGVPALIVWRIGESRRAPVAAAAAAAAD